MDTFTIVTGIASLIGLAIQLFGFFPKFARFRIPSLLLFFGVFIGGFLHAFDASRIKITFQFTTFTIILTVVATIIILFLIAAAFSGDANRKKEFYWVVRNSIAIFFFCLLAIPPILSSQEGKNDQLSVNELNTLSEHALQNKDFERAIMYLQTIESRNIDGAQMKLTQVKIQQIKSQELK